MQSPTAETTLCQSAAIGLTTDQARARLHQYGANRLRDTRQAAWVWQYLSHFKNPLVLILLIASSVSAAAGELSNFFIISCIVIFSVTLDFAQEYRATAVAEKLRQSVSIQAAVWRDSQLANIPVFELVPGDVVLLTAGDLTPADGWLFEAHDFFVNQSLLTGESYPVEKLARPLSLPVTDLPDASHLVFMGTSIISGSARMYVTRTGAYTQIGGIADSVINTTEPTSFELSTRLFGLMILRLTLLMVMFVVLANIVWHQHEWLSAFLFAAALAVGLTPELLPMVVSVTLARGSMRMAAKQMIVKRQSSIQDLGSMDVLCTDKTGTLTESRIRLEAHVDLRGQSSDNVLMIAALNSHFESGLKSPLDEAILAHKVIDVGTWTKIDEVPFDFERRRVSVLLEQAGQRWLMVKGAPDDIMLLCTEAATDGLNHTIPFDEATRQAAQKCCKDFEKEGMRVLGVACRHVPFNHAHAVVNDESALVFAGFVAFLDPPKQSAAETLQTLEKIGIAIKVVTGDSEIVTQHVCAQLGLHVQGVLTGSEISTMDDAALGAMVEHVNLFCRMNPAQKNRVIHALKFRGHVVGYLGDGINDLPALHAADVSLSVDSAADVAKAEADMIMLQHNLSVLHDAVLEGRRTFGNIMKYILMSTSSNFGNMFSMAGSVIFLPFLPMLPTQILLNNVLYDLSEITIPFDSVDTDDTKHPRVMDMTLIRNFMLTIGPVSSLFDFLTFYVMLAVFNADERLFQTGWFIESLCTQVLVIFVIRTRGKFWRSKPHPWLVTTSILVVCIAAFLPFTVLGEYFGFTPPPIVFYAALLAMTMLYLGSVELIKHWFYVCHHQTK